MSNDPITYATDIINIVDEKINELPEIFADEESLTIILMHSSDFLELKVGSLKQLLNKWGSNVNKISSVQKIKLFLRPFLMKTKTGNVSSFRKVFANGSMNYDSKILANLMYERGTRSSSGNNDPDFHALVLSSQSNILRNILHPEV